MRSLLRVIRYYLRQRESPLHYINYHHIIDGCQKNAKPALNDAPVIEQNLLKDF